MTALKNRFWAKVLFKEFIRHYRKLTDEQKVADINASMDALEDLDDSGDSFGAKMVRWSMERAEEPSAIASRENGKKGGRPRKNQETTADGDIREDSLNVTDGSNAALLESGASANNYGVAPHREAGDVSATDSNNSEAPQIRRTGGSSARGMAKVAQPPVRSLRLPTWDEFTEFIDALGLDYTDAREWWEMTMVDRKGLDRYGKPIANWKGALKRFCTTKTANRRTA